MDAQIFEAQLDQTTYKHLVQCLTPKIFDAGQVIFSQNDTTTGLFFINTGSVFIYRQSGDKRQILALLGANDCFGGESAINRTVSPYAARAVTATKSLWLPPDNLINFIQDYPDFLNTYLSLITTRLHQLTLLVHDLAFRDVPARLAAVLMMFADVYGEPQKDGIFIPQIVSQGELAEMVGTAREVIYRTLRHFERNAILSKENRAIHIHDLQALRTIAQAEAK